MIPNIVQTRPFKPTHLDLPSWLGLAILAVPVLILNIPNLSHTFVSDDWYILQEVSGKGFTGSTFLAGSGYVRPFGMWTWSAAYHLFGLNPAPYYLLALLLHLGNVWLVYAIISRILGSRLAGLVGGLVFGTYYLGWEPTSWLASTFFDVQCAFFMLLALWLFLELEVSLQAGWHFWLYFSGFAVCYLIATFSKETGVLLLGICLFYDLMCQRLGQRRKSQTAIIYASMLVVVAAFFITHYWLPTDTNTTAALNFSRVVDNIIFYGEGLGLPLFPYNLGGGQLLRHELKFGLWLLPLVPICGYLLVLLWKNKLNQAATISQKGFRENWLNWLKIKRPLVRLLLLGVVWIGVCSLATTSQKYVFFRFLYIADVGLAFSVAALVASVLKFVARVQLPRAGKLIARLATGYTLAVFCVGGMIGFAAGRDLYTRASDFTQQLATLAKSQIKAGVTDITLVNMPREIEQKGTGLANLFYDPKNPELVIFLQYSFTMDHIQVLRTAAGTKLGYDVTGDLTAAKYLPEPSPTHAVITADYKGDGNFTLVLQP